MKFLILVLTILLTTCGSLKPRKPLNCYDGTGDTNGDGRVDVEDCKIVATVQGPPGVDGEDGSDGLDGKDGAPGKDGVDGKDGLNGVDGKDGGSCFVSANSQGALIECDDGTSAQINHGNNGTDGAPGSDGILQIIDPCGDDPGHPDEVLFVLSTGDIAAWYKDVGLVVLDDGNYITTDHQKCRFSIVNGEYQE